MEQIMNADLTQKLITDYKVLMTDTETLVKATASQSADKIAAARDRMQSALLELKPRLANAEAVLRDNARDTLSATDEYVHQNPWTAMGVAAGVGVVIGLLVTRH